MWAPAVIKVEIAADRCTGITDAVIGPQIHLLVFDASPQTLDEDIVAPGAFAVHADGDTGLDQSASELTSLVGVEDVRLAVASESILQRLDAERRLHGDRYARRQHAAAEPIEHDGKIDEAASHRNVRDVHRPYLVGAP